MRDNLLGTAAGIFLPMDSKNGGDPAADRQNKRGTLWREDSGGRPD